MIPHVSRFAQDLSDKNYVPLAKEAAVLVLREEPERHLQQILRYSGFHRIIEGLLQGHRGILQKKLKTRLVLPHRTPRVFTGPA